MSSIVQPSRSPSTPLATAPECRTMWMVPRNIRRIEPWKIVQISTLLNAAGGNAQNQMQQNAIYKELELQGVKCSQSKDGVPNPGGLRTYLAQLACLGLFYQDADNKSYVPTPAGEEILAARNPVRVLACQLMRMQYPSVYGLGNNVRISPEMKVKPFVFILNLLDRPELEGVLSADEIGVAVVYGRTHEDEDLVAAKILKMRRSKAKGAVARFQEIVDDIADICTPRRWKLSEADLWEKGVTDALTIGNTFKNYMQSADLLVPSAFGQGYFEAHIDASLASSIAAWRIEPVEPAPLHGYEERWQLRFGRCDKMKVQKRRGSFVVNGFAALVGARFISQAKADPYGFDHDSFVDAEAKTWGKTKAEIEAVLTPFKTKTKSLFRDELMHAAFSGGEESRTLEKGVANIFLKLGFDLSRHTGQISAPSTRDGGYPDVWIQVSGLAGSGWADAKATSRYGFALGDSMKLSGYYKECWKEIDSKAPSWFFVYVAGGFARSQATIARSLQDCTAKYGRPVSAVTVEALCDLVESGDAPKPADIVSALSKSRFYNSARQIIQSADEED